MPDFETRHLDAEILGFIKKYSQKPAPQESFRLLALKIFDYQCRKNSAYRKFCLLAGKDPKNVSDWKEVPAMPAVGFKELALSTFPICRAVKTFKTSGTTQGDRGSHYFDTLSLAEAAIVPAFQKYLMPDAGNFSFFYLMASPQEAPSSSLSYMMGVVNKRFADSRGKFYVRHDKINCDALAADLERVGRQKKVIILSTAFSLKAFLDYLEAKKKVLRLKDGSRLMETGGFKGRVSEVSKTRLYQDCEKRLGIKKGFCVSEYGMTELSSQFYDNTLRNRGVKSKHWSFKEGPAWIKTLVIDPASGKEARKGARGLLRHFDLANRGSVLAVQTEDLGRAVDGGFELIGRARGSELRGCSLNYEDLIRTVNT